MTNVTAAPQWQFQHLETEENVMELVDNVEWKSSQTIWWGPQSQTSFIFIRRWKRCRTDDVAFAWVLSTVPDPFRYLWLTSKIVPHATVELS